MTLPLLLKRMIHAVGAVFLSTSGCSLDRTPRFL